MENNYNFKTNPSPLGKKDIEKHKDFDALLKRVESTTPPKNQMKVLHKKGYYWIGGIAATLLIGILSYVTLFNDAAINEDISSAYFATQPYVNPPLEDLAKPSEIITVNANEGGTYQFPSGSRMVVPKAAFANAYGTMIEGEVEVHFKEYHDYIDFFLSGIPMEIHMDGKAGVLESAGMIEVYATQNGERVQMLPEKPIDIELKSQIAFKGDTPPEFNIYFLDEEKRAWTIQGKDEIELVKNNIHSGSKVEGDPPNPNLDGTNINDIAPPDTPESLANTFQATTANLDEKLNREIAAIDRQITQPIAPEKPEKYDGNSMTMELDFANSNASAAKNYEGTIWQVLSPIAAFSDVSATVWEQYDLSPQGNSTYLLNLQKGDKKAQLSVKPVLAGQDYQKALQVFEEKLEVYQKEKEKLLAEIEAKKAEIKERIAIEKENAKKGFDERIAALKARGHANYATNEIVKQTILNRFQINRFGIWNCDRPRPAYLATLDGTFQDQHFHKYSKNVVYQTDKSQNTVRRFYLEDIVKNVQFNTESDNLLWLVTKENKLAVVYPADFKEIEQKEGTYTFDMELNEQPINSEKDVRAILKL